jgi:hypothetical protein
MLHTVTHEPIHYCHHIDETVLTCTAAGRTLSAEAAVVTLVDQHKRKRESLQTLLVMMLLILFS